MAHAHPSILLVEDNDDVREVLEFYFSREGYKVAAARDGSEALEILRTLTPCIIVLDLAMPGMTGQAFRAAQLADRELSKIPVLICSAAYDIKATSEQLGAVGFAQKPIEVPALMGMIRQHCLK